jgi:hypothetical protein
MQVKILFQACAFSGSSSKSFYGKTEISKRREVHSPGKDGRLFAQVPMGFRDEAREDGWNRERYA